MYSVILTTLCILLFVAEVISLYRNETQHGEDELFHNKRSLINTADRLWPKGILPYKIVDDPPIHTREYLKVIAMYDEFSCIRLVEWDPNIYNKYGLTHKTFLVFKQVDGCFASVGFYKNSQNGHTLNCCTQTACLHEIGHNLGFTHEQRNPKRQGWIRFDHEYVWPKNQQLFQESNSKQYYPSRYEFDFGSPMLYQPWMFAFGKGAETALFPELKWRYDYFYFFKEIADGYKCHEHKPCNAKVLKCMNEGYTSIIRGKCQCVCLPGLDPATGCATVLKKVKVEWPNGDYALPLFDEDCHHGSYFTKGKMELSNANRVIWKQNYCSRIQGPNWEPNNKFNWPIGNFCIFRRNGKCPLGFTDASIEFPSHSSNSRGRLPDVENNALHMCCQYKGFENVETSFPTEQPFTLIKNGNSCQKVTGMSVSEVKKTTNGNKSTYKTKGLHFFALNRNGRTLTIPYCHYIPLDRDCGEIITLDKNTRTTTVESSAKGRTNLECTWLIKIQDGLKGTMVLDFDSFDVKSCEDKVEVRHARAGQTGNSYCGPKIKHSIRSIEDKMMIRFFTKEESDSSFKATIKWIPDEEMCIDSKDRGVTYNGRTNFTRLYKPCLPWSQVTHCQHHSYNSGDSRQILEGNFCRNPDNSFRPWCYTDPKDCQRNYCDVCGLEKPFDRSDNCLKMKETGFCSRDLANATRICAKTCSDVIFKQQRKEKTYPTIQCGAPRAPTGAGILGSRLQSIYQLGDEAQFKCAADSGGVIKSTCMTNGQWSPVKSSCNDNGCNNKLGEACTVLLEEGPSMCTDFPVFAASNCARTCGKCGICAGTVFKGQCYTPSTVKKSYEQAIETCRDNQQTLAVPRNMEEVQILDKLMKGKGFYFIGIDDRLKEGHFTYPDGTALVWTNWRQGNPDNYGKGEDCVVVHPDGTWADVGCSDYTVPFVCSSPHLPVNKDTESCQLPTSADQNMIQLQPISKSTISVGEYAHFSCVKYTYRQSGDEKRACLPGNKLTGTPLKCGDCPSGFTTFGGTCNLLIRSDTHQRATFAVHDAKSTCQAIGGFVAKPKTPTDIYKLQSMSDGSPIWIDASSVGTKDTTCRGEWLKGKCYTPFYLKKTYDEAVKICQSYKTTLAAPRNKEETSFMDKLMKGKSYYLIGINDKTKEGQWVYPDGEHIVWTNWNKGEPNNIGTDGEDCALAGIGAGWADVPCSLYKAPFVCVATSPNKVITTCGKPTIPSDGVFVNNGDEDMDVVGSVVNFKCKTSSMIKKAVCQANGKWSKVTSACKECESGGKWINNACYYVLSNGRKMQYDLAEKVCKNKGGNLPVPINAEENAVINNFVGFKWLGINDKAIEGEWVKDDGVSLSWTSWRTNGASEPDNWGVDGENCAVVAGEDASWRDVSCGSRYKAVCVVPTDEVCHRLSPQGQVETVKCNNYNSVVCSISKNDVSQCYDPHNKGLTYNGNVNVGANGKSCLPWNKVTKCNMHPYKLGLKINNLVHNYCRNPDNSRQPWCYTDDSCHYQYCDVCQPGENGDKEKVKNYKMIECKSPSLPTGGHMVGPSRTFYRLGEQVHFKCKTSGFRVSKTCLSNGQWSEAGTACTECPDGYELRDNVCYHFKNIRLKYGQAKEECSKDGAFLPQPKSDADHKNIMSTSGKNYRVWLGAQYVDKKLEWEDKSPKAWSNWNTNFPKGSSSCVFMTNDNTGKWQNVDCSWRPPKMGLVCSANKQDAPREDFLDSQCPDLINSNPSMCEDFPQFADKFCYKTCHIKYCDVPKLLYGQRQPNLNKVDKGDKVFFACSSKAIEVSGDRERVCQPSGTLTGKPLVCKDIFDKDVVLQGVPSFSNSKVHSIPVGVLLLGVNDLFTVKQAGRVAAWEYSTGVVSSDIYFQIWRQTKHSSNIYKLVGENKVHAPSRSRDRYTVPRSQRIHVENGDVIGVLSSGVGGLHYSQCDEKVHPRWAGLARSKLPEATSAIEANKKLFVFQKENVCITFEVQAVIVSDQ